VRPLQTLREKGVAAGARGEPAMAYQGRPGAKKRAYSSSSGPGHPDKGVSLLVAEAGGRELQWRRRTHLGTYECRICRTTQRTDAAWLAHAVSKRHLANVAWATRDTEGVPPQGSEREGKGREDAGGPPSHGKEEEVGPVPGPEDMKLPRPEISVRRQFDRTEKTRSVLVRVAVDPKGVRPGTRPVRRMLGAFRGDPDLRFCVFWVPGFCPSAVELDRGTRVDETHPGTFERWFEDEGVLVAQLTLLPSAQASGAR